MKTDIFFIFSIPLFRLVNTFSKRDYLLTWKNFTKTYLILLFQVLFQENLLNSCNIDETKAI